MKPLLSVTSVAVQAQGVLRVSWDDGVTRDVDVSSRLDRHPVLAMLNIAEVFRDVSVVPGGGGVEWVNGADFSARSLRIWSDEQIDMNARKAS
jgi:hypothetical protein